MVRPPDLGQQCTFNDWSVWGHKDPCPNSKQLCRICRVSRGSCCGCPTAELLPLPCPALFRPLPHTVPAWQSPSQSLTQGKPDLQQPSRVHVTPLFAWVCGCVSLEHWEKVIALESESGSLTVCLAQALPVKNGDDNTYLLESLSGFGSVQCLDTGNVH